MVCVQPYSSTTELHFSASFASSEEYHQARQDGVEVELWSNIPNAHGSDTKWGADRFVWPSGNYTGTSHASGEYFPIVCEGPSSLEVLHLRVGIPVSGRNQVEYTYRLVYPSGEIKWLGDYERNGVLVFEQRDPRFVHGIFFGSHMREGTYSLGRGGWHKKKIARLSQEVDWSIYAIGADGSVCTHTPLLSISSVCILGHLVFMDRLTRRVHPMSPWRFSYPCYVRNHLLYPAPSPLRHLPVPRYRLMLLGIF